MAPLAGLAPALPLPAGDRSCLFCEGVSGLSPGEGDLTVPPVAAGEPLPGPEFQAASTAENGGQREGTRRQEKQAEVWHACTKLEATAFGWRWLSED